MIRKAMPVVVASVVTMILTTIFRPLEFLQSMAAAQIPIAQATDFEFELEISGDTARIRYALP